MLTLAKSFSTSFPYKISKTIVPIYVLYLYTPGSKKVKDFPENTKNWKPNEGV